MVESHLLRPSPYFEGELITANGRMLAREENEQKTTLITKKGFPAARSAEVYFEELYYLPGKDEGLRVLCISVPLEGKIRQQSLQQKNLRSMSVAAAMELKSAAECEGFLRRECSNGREALDRCEQVLNEFNRTYVLVGGYVEHTARKLGDISTQLADHLFEGVSQVQMK
eukprot:gene17903-21317_t